MVDEHFIISIISMLQITVFKNEKKNKKQRIQSVKLATGLKTEPHKCSVSLVKRGVTVQ
jgi:hypothetical protein